MLFEEATSTSALIVNNTGNSQKTKALELALGAIEKAPQMQMGSRRRRRP